MMYLMGIWLLFFGLIKIPNIPEFAKSFSRYDIIAKRIKIYGYIFPFIEIFTGIIYIVDTEMKYMLEVSLVVGVISLLGMISAFLVLKSKIKIECACMGTFWKLPMTKITFIENGAMFLMILLMLFGFLMMNQNSLAKHCKTMPEMVGCEEFN